MAQTHHFKARMSQRGIKKSVADLVRDYGRMDGDKIRLDKSEAEALLQELRALERATKTVIDKGGVIVVEVDGVAITTYNTNTHRRPAGRRQRPIRASRPEGYR